MSRSNNVARLVMAGAIALFALISFFSSRQYNEITGENQFVSISKDQEIALGLEAAPEMIQQYGGLEQDPAAQERLDEIGNRLVRESVAADTEWQWEFYLLDDDQVINAFALPGGQLFITNALYTQLEGNDTLIAGVMGHEIGHVLARHGAQRLAKAELTQSLTQAVYVVSEGGAQAAAIIGQLVNMQYGRDDELESDQLGVEIMSDAGYDPRALIVVMEILADSRSGDAPPEFFSTHPNPDNRIEEIQEAIDEIYPDGVPDNLEGTPPRYQ